ncbi:MAG: hypothetical protein ABFS56_20595 [Pseudomonadota bacterium]
MKNKRQFILAATLLALFSSPLLYAFEDCGTSITECKRWQAIEASQEDYNPLLFLTFTLFVFLLSTTY